MGERMTVAYHTAYNRIGWSSSLQPSAESFAIDAADGDSDGYGDDWLAFSFVAPPSGPVINKIKVYASAVAGTLTELSCSIWSDNAGVPGSQLAESTTVTALPTGAAWVEFVGFTYDTTGGTLYWIVLRNKTATPASNTITFRFGTISVPYYMSTSGAWGHMAKASADGGATWAGMTVRYGVLGWRIEYADGFQGGALHNRLTGGTADAVYDKREQGALFTTPATGNFVVCGVAAFMHKQGTPTRALRFRLYQGVTLVATTGVIPVANVTASYELFAFFSTAVTLTTNTAYRVVASVAYEGSGDGDTNNYFRVVTMAIEDDANSRALMPLRGWQKTYTADASAAPVEFAETATDVPCIALLLDSDTAEISAAASGGGVPVFGGNVARRV